MIYGNIYSGRDRQKEKGDDKQESILYGYKQTIIDALGITYFSPRHLINYQKRMSQKDVTLLLIRKH